MIANWSRAGSKCSPPRRRRPAMDVLIERLQAGCVYRPKRWRGDTHDDLGGPIDEAATESLLAEAAEALEAARAVPEGQALVSTSQLDRWETAAGAVAEYMSRAKVSRHIYAQSELLAAEIHFELATAPSPELEK